MAATLSPLLPGMTQGAGGDGHIDHLHLSLLLPPGEGGSYSRAEVGGTILRCAQVILSLALY